MKKQIVSRGKTAVINFGRSFGRMCRGLLSDPRSLTVLICFCWVTFAFADGGTTNSAGDYSAGTNALDTVSQKIAEYVPYAVKVCYAIAAVVAVVGAISVYIKMNNEEQDVKKSIMLLVGACLFLIAAAQALPLFFISSGAGANP